MITLKLNGKEVQCPTCYKELSTGAYQRVISGWDQEKDLAERDYFKLFSLITRTDYHIVPSPENEVTIWNAVGWYVSEPFKFSAKLPKALEIGEKKISIPQSIGSISIGQNILLRQAITKSKYMEENISLAVAICLQPLYDEAKFDFSRAKELEEKILEMPIYLTHPVGFYLLQTAIRFGQKPSRGLQHQRISLKRILKGMWQRLQGSKSSQSLTTYHS